MKKNELKKDTAYFCSSRPRLSAWSESYFQNAERNKSERFYIIFDEEGNPLTAYKNPSMVYASHCKNYGRDCDKHDNSDGRIRCYRTDFRLMDIRGDFYSMIKYSTDRRKAERADEGRGQRLANRNRRIAERNRRAVEDPIKQQFIAELRRVWPVNFISSYDKLGDLNVELMKTITEALQRYVQEVPVEA